MKFSPFLATAVLMLLPLSAANAAETTTYVYDALGRLVTVMVAGSVNNGVQVTYTQDAADNRSNVTVTGAPQ